MVKGSIFSGSYYSSEEEVKIAKANLINIGFDEIEYFSLGKKYFTQWAGSPRERLDNFYKCWNSNSEIIFGMRGGSGISHFFQLINKEKINKKKLFCGYSDLTLILLYLNQDLGLISLHGPNSLKELDKKSISALKEAIQMKNYGINFKKTQTFYFVRNIIIGTTIGGNLTRIIEYLVHRKIDFNKKVVFIEDTHITKEQLIGYCFHLVNYNSFKPSAILVGDLGIKLTNNLKNQLKEIFKNIPIIFELPFGHVTPNITIPLGVKAILDLQNEKLTFIFPESEKSYAVKLEDN